MLQRYLAARAFGFTRRFAVVVAWRTRNLHPELIAARLAYDEWQTGSQ